ncbi:hypothetical protein D9M70_577110 [compost metagenome]
MRPRGDVHPFHKHTVMVHARRGVDDTCETNVGTGIHHSARHDNRPVPNPGKATDDSRRMYQDRQMKALSREFLALPQTHSVVANCDERTIEVAFFVQQIVERSQIGQP